MSRRGGGSTRGDFEEEEHFVRKGPGRREEFDSYKRRGTASPPPRERERQVPEFMREEYTKREVDNGPLVLRQKEVETFTRAERERPRQRSPSPPPERVVRTRIVERTRSLSPEPVERERVRTRFIQRERSPSPPPPERERVVRTRIVERERQRERSPSPPPLERIVRTRVVERERERSRSPSPPPERMIRTRIVERTQERSPSPPPERVRTRTIQIQRNRSPSPPPERTTTRIIEREDFRRGHKSPSPERERSRIVVRERIMEPSPPSPSPSPPLPPPIIREPAIHQDIITHHHHYNIDHGVLYEPVKAPSPPPPPKAKSRGTEIDIYTSKNETEIDIFKGKALSSKGPPSSKAGGSRDEDDIFFERDRLTVRDKRGTRRRSLSTRREEKWEDEAEYYDKRAEERAYMGEAWNGATKDWAIVDVPPGTERVVMDGIGGGGQEITWQKYNGVRRSKFIPVREKEEKREKERDTTIIYKEEKIKEIEPAGREMAVYEREYEREEITGGGERSLGKWNPKPKEKEHPYWTEITKDLVIREAIEEMGYEFDETEDFFYVIQYLKYEDVLNLVKISEVIRAERKERIREIAWEKEKEKERKKKEKEREEKMLKEMGSYEDERIYEREVIYDGPRRGGERRYFR